MPARMASTQTLERLGCAFGVCGLALAVWWLVGPGLAVQAEPDSAAVWTRLEAAVAARADAARGAQFDALVGSLAAGASGLDATLATIRRGRARERESGARDPAVDAGLLDAARRVGRDEAARDAGDGVPPWGLAAVAALSAAAVAASAAARHVRRAEERRIVELCGAHAPRARDAGLAAEVARALAAARAVPRHAQSAPSPPSRDDVFPFGRVLEISPAED